MENWKGGGMEEEREERVDGHQVKGRSWLGDPEAAYRLGREQGCCLLRTLDKCPCCMSVLTPNSESSLSFQFTL